MSAPFNGLFPMIPMETTARRSPAQRRRSAAASGDKQFFASLTHLVIRPGMPLAREIGAYQKHRRKRLRRGQP